MSVCNHNDRGWLGVKSMSVDVCIIYPTYHFSFSIKFVYHNVDHDYSYVLLSA